MKDIKRRIPIVLIVGQFVIVMMLYHSSIIADNAGTNALELHKGGCPAWFGANRYDCHPDDCPPLGVFKDRSCSVRGTRLYEICTNEKKCINNLDLWW